MSKKERKAAPEKTPLQQAEEKIKLCSTFAYISAGLTIAVSVLAMMDISLLGFTADGAIFSIIEGLLIAGLGFGVSKKSRACALALLALFGLDKVLQIIDDPRSISSMVASIIIWGTVYVGGVSGTFKYRKLKQGEDEQAALAEENPYAAAEEANPYAAAEEANPYAEAE